MTICPCPLLEEVSLFIGVCDPSAQPVRQSTVIPGPVAAAAAQITNLRGELKFSTTASGQQ